MKVKGGGTGLVVCTVFKTVEGWATLQVGSIPMRLRQSVPGGLCILENYVPKSRNAVKHAVFAGVWGGSPI